jgi:2-oxoglutarate dehydrogenase E2 component (dihydrolipoamide succinyltransferase)
MGESIAEGTVSKWLKSVGDSVERDEPILEISTDKVDAEIPAPASGTLVGIEVKEGETVEVGTIVAYIDTEAMADGKTGGAPTHAPTAARSAAAPAPSAQSAPPPPPSAPPPPPKRAEPERGEAAAAAGRTAVAAAVEPHRPPVAERQADGDQQSAEDRLRMRSTPVVRRIAGEHGIDIADVPGTGHAGRVTKQDILAFIEAGAPVAQAEPPAAPGTPSPAAPVAPSAAPAAAPSDFWKTFYNQVQHPEFPVREGDKVEPMDKIRRLTAEHMVLAKRVAPHVHSFIEIDFTRVDRMRRENKKRWEEQGVRVSFTAFVAWACSRVLTEFPNVNATISGNNIVYRGSVNLGIAVDLDPGLIVPVIKNASDLSLAGIAKRIVDLADRARKRQLTPDEIQGATFSITNPGVLGTLVGMPIIPKGTAAILGTGAVEKRPVVVEDPDTGADAIGIRMRSIFSLGYDHRLVDGADAARFLARLKAALQDFPEDA